MSRLAFCFFLIPLFLAAPARADGPQPSLAMYGEAKYPPGFAHFDYANPDAPKRGTLKLGFTGSFDTLNPFNLIGQPPVGVATGFYSLIYQPLMARSWDEPFTLYGLIAESVEVPEDRSSITFNVNPAARWQDGQAVTADDILFSWKILRDKGRPNTRLFYSKVTKAEKLGPLAVKFTFERNTDGSLNREMPLIMGLMPVLPQHEWENRDFEKSGWKLPVGSGPYKVTAIDEGRSITYTRDPNYWGRDIPTQRGLYNFASIRMDYYRDDHISLEAFKAGAYDWRREFDVKKWITAYEAPALKNGLVTQEQDRFQNTAPAYGYILNTRRAPLKDPDLREALQYTFDFEWINKTLFHDQYKRVASFFPNSELAAPPLPKGKEREILEKIRDRLPPDIFTKPVTPPITTPDGLRANLLRASEILRKAGYTLRDDQLYAPDGKAVKFEILLADPSEQKVALEWRQLLKRIGIDCYVHPVDSAQYEQRMRKFDFDITAGHWINSQSPGNEQSNYWSSAAADQPGSRNYPGIKSTVIDTLAAAIPVTRTREDLIASVHALDRVLMAGHYMVPLYYSDSEHIAYWTDRLDHPKTLPLYGSVLETWWAKKPD